MANSKQQPESVRNPWHYPRGDFARQTLETLGTGLIRRMALFAPRRKGKTWFLLGDLAPAAHRRHVIPVYASMWDSPDRPHEALIDALTRARDASRKRQGWTTYIGHLKELTLAASPIRATFVPDVGAPQQADSKSLTALETLVRELLERSHGGVLLMVDEAQHLATNPAFEPFLARLRTLLDTLEASGEGIGTIFTGSSRTDLSELFESPKAPFFRSATVVDLPELGEDYVNFVATKLAGYGVKVSANSLRESYKRFDHSPYYMNEMAKYLMLRQAKTAKEAEIRVRSDIAANPLFASAWRDASELDRAVFGRIAAGDAVYSEGSRKLIAAQVGRAELSAWQVQASVKKLVRWGIVSKGPDRGSFRVEDSGFAVFLEQLEQPEVQ